MKNYFFVFIFYNAILFSAQEENTICGVLKTAGIVVAKELKKLESSIAFTDKQYITEETRGYFFTKPFCFPMPFIRKCCLVPMEISDTLYYCKTQLDQLGNLDTILSGEYDNEVINGDTQNVCNDIILRYHNHLLDKLVFHAKPFLPTIINLLFQLTEQKPQLSFYEKILFESPSFYHAHINRYGPNARGFFEIPMKHINDIPSRIADPNSLKMTGRCYLQEDFFLSSFENESPEKVLSEDVNEVFPIFYKKSFYVLAYIYLYLGDPETERPIFWKYSKTLKEILVYKYDGNQLVQFGAISQEQLEQKIKNDLNLEDIDLYKNIFHIIYNRIKPDENFTVSPKAPGKISQYGLSFFAVGYLSLIACFWGRLALVQKERIGFLDRYLSSVKSIFDNIKHNTLVQRNLLGGIDVSKVFVEFVIFHVLVFSPLIMSFFALVNGASLRQMWHLW